MNTHEDKSYFKMFSNQLNILLWKNFLLQKRYGIGTLIEILLPAVFAIILLPIRTIVKSQQIKNDTTFIPFSVDTFYPNFKFDSLNIGYAPNNSERLSKIMKTVSSNFKLKLMGLICI